MICSDSKSSDHKACIIEIQIGPATQLRDNEIDGRQQFHSQLSLVNKIGRTLSIPWRHRYNGPPREVFGEVCRELVPVEESSQRFD